MRKARNVKGSSDLVDLGQILYLYQYVNWTIILPSIYLRIRKPKNEIHGKEDIVYLNQKMNSQPFLLERRMICLTDETNGDLL